MYLVVSLTLRSLKDEDRHKCLHGAPDANDRPGRESDSDYMFASVRISLLVADVHVGFFRTTRRRNEKTNSRAHEAPHISRSRLIQCNDDNTGRLMGLTGASTCTMRARNVAGVKALGISIDAVAD